MEWNKIDEKEEIPLGRKLAVTDGEIMLSGTFYKYVGWIFDTIAKNEIEPTHWAWLDLPQKKEYREILFQGINLETGQYVQGNYIHNVRKGVCHIIRNKDTNEDIYISREHLQMMNEHGEWVDV